MARIVYGPWTTRSIVFNFASFSSLCTTKREKIFLFVMFIFFRVFPLKGNKHKAHLKSNDSTTICATFCSNSVLQLDSQYKLNNRVREQDSQSFRLWPGKLACSLCGQSKREKEEYKKKCFISCFFLVD